MTKRTAPPQTIERHSIANKVRRCAAGILLALIITIVFLLRMQYILVFQDRTQDRLSADVALLADCADPAQLSDISRLTVSAETAQVDNLLLLIPQKSGEFRVVLCHGNGGAYRSSLAGQVVRTGQAVSDTQQDLGFGVRTYIHSDAYHPIFAEDGSVAAVLYGHNSAYCPFFSHTFRNTFYFFGVFVVVCLLMLFYNHRVTHIVIAPLETLKTDARALVKDDAAFAFMDQEGNELQIIRNAFVALQDRQQRLDESLDYAKEIQSRILARKQDFIDTFRDHGIFYKPLALVSGDFYWMEQFERGSVLVMGDCTGHGIPGALMTMMVISILDSIVNEANCQDTKYILWRLDQQLSSILNTQKKTGEAYIKHGLDVIVIFMDRQHKTIKLSSASTNLYVVKPLNSIEVVRGQRLFIGDGKIQGKSQVKSVYLKYSPKCCYFMATDGLFEQIGGKKRIPYGYSRFKSILFEHSAAGINPTIQALMQDFYSYMHGEIQRDDITIIGFRL